LPIIDYREYFTTIVLLTIEHMAMIVVKCLKKMQRSIAGHNLYNQYVNNRLGYREYFTTLVLLIIEHMAMIVVKFQIQINSQVMDAM